MTEIPPNCGTCSYHYWTQTAPCEYDDRCTLTDESVRLDTRPADCPLEADE